MDFLIHLGDLDMRWRPEPPFGFQKNLDIINQLAYSMHAEHFLLATCYPKNFLFSDLVDADRLPSARLFNYIKASPS